MGVTGTRLPESKSKLQTLKCAAGTCTCNPVASSAIPCFVFVFVFAFVFVLFLLQFLLVVLFCNVTAVDLILMLLLLNVICSKCLIPELCVFRLKMKWTR